MQAEDRGALRRAKAGAKLLQRRRQQKERKKLTSLDQLAEALVEQASQAPQAKRKRPPA